MVKATGSFEVTIEVLEEGNSDASAVDGPVETRISGMTKSLLSKIPRRVRDSANHPGDMVNVLIVGTQDQVIQAFTAAGWVQVDTSIASTVINAILESLEKKDDLTMPHSLSVQSSPGLWVCACGTSPGRDVAKSSAPVGVPL